MRVLDLFCGPGGLSEGFRMAGHHTVFAADLNKDACLTYSKNHQEAIVENVDILALDYNTLPEFDILIGGPPCVNFSHSKGSRRNVLEGLLLVQAFLRLVYERKPIYWVMENVPTIAKYLPNEIPLKWIGIDKEGYLDVPVKLELNAADFGVPQARKRYLVGNYPVPSKTHGCMGKNGFNPWLTLEHALSSLVPHTDSSGRSVVKDINYGFYIQAELLTDHNMDTSFEETEVSRIKAAKLEHPYMGKMAFPDDVSRPARTVVATQLGRETVVIQDNNSQSGYRRLTVRECATLQSFPITYQFWANSLSSKYKMAGDAVPPKLSFSIAHQIPRELNCADDYPIILRTEISEPAPPPSKSVSRRKQQFRFDRKFARMVPGKEVRGCRVEFDNICDTTRNGNFVWNCRLHVGEGKGTKRDKIFTYDESIALLSGLERLFFEEGKLLVHNFIKSLEEMLHDVVVDGNELQKMWSSGDSGMYSPDELCKRLTAVINEHFPRDRFGAVKIPNIHSTSITKSGGILVRLAAALVATSFLCHIINANHCRDVCSNQ